MKRHAVIVAVVVGLVAGVVMASRVLTGSQAPDPRPPTLSSLDGERSAEGPAADPEQDPERSEQGARTAAIAVATASQDWLYLSDEQIDRAVRTITTSSAAASLSKETVAELRTSRDALAMSPGRVWWLVRPLASRVERFDPMSARVVVWVVTVLSAADVALPQADWARVTLDLLWESDSWRLQAINDIPGPTPMTGTRDQPWQPEPFDDALDGFERVLSEA